MARSGGESFEKRQRAKARQERNQAKRSRREERRTSDTDEPDVEVDEAALMAAYGRLAERHDAGEIDDDTFAERKLELFTALGLDVT